MVGKYKVITLCGSTKFKDQFLEVQKKLTLEGNIVISVGLFGHSGDNEVWTEGTKEMLDDMHKRKIDMADEIFVINVNKYIGESTDSCFGLTKGNYYYWPTQIDNPGYNGVIDDEEFTSYLYPTEPQLWEIAEDPTGMAYRTIYKKENYCSSESLNSVVNQVKTAMEKDEYIYLSVEFRPNAKKTYYYTTDDSSIAQPPGKRKPPRGGFF